MNGNKIILDMYLCALLTKEESKSSTTPDTIPRDQLVDRFIKKCQQCYEIKLPGKDAVFKFGVPPVIQISVKLRSGNKKVTSVARFETYGISSTELSSELKIICASSTSVTPLPGKGVNAGDEVMVQGDKVKEICELLQGKYGITFKLTGSGKKTTYTSRFVEVVYAKGAK